MYTPWIEGILFRQPPPMLHLGIEVQLASYSSGNRFLWWRLENGQCEVQFTWHICFEFLWCSGTFIFNMAVISMILVWIICSLLIQGELIVFFITENVPDHCKQQWKVFTSIENNLCVCEILMGLFPLFLNTLDFRTLKVRERKLEALAQCL